jgi:uncharacterized protein (TIGR00369 family)
MMRDLKMEVQRIFDRAAFIRQLEIQLLAVGDGTCETRLRTKPEHAQQHGHIHAGVISTLADHTCGGAARAAVAEGQDVLTIEFKINFLRPGNGPELRAQGKTLRAGKNIAVAEAEVFDVTADGDVLIAKCTSTLAVIRPRD